jgi:hypothetical protein
MEASVLERAETPAPRPILDVHNVKERDATGAVVKRKRSRCRWRAQRRTRKKHADRFWMS